MIHAALVRRPIDPMGLVATASHPAHGAIVLFAGTVRELNEGRAVEGIEYRAYDAMAEAELGRIAREAADLHGVRMLLVEHRVGELGVGEVSVAIVAAHPHRHPALRALEQVIEQLKVRVPIWKRELYVDGSREWVAPMSTAQPFAASEWGR